MFHISLCEVIPLDLWVVVGVAQSVFSCLIYVIVFFSIFDFSSYCISGLSCVHIPYSLDQTLLSISHRSRIVAALPDELKEIDAALDY